MVVVGAFLLILLHSDISQPPSAPIQACYLTISFFLHNVGLHFLLETLISFGISRPIADFYADDFVHHHTTSFFTFRVKISDMVIIAMILLY